MTTSFGDVIYAYDALDRLTTLSNPFLETWTFLYNSLGGVTEIRLPNTVVTKVSYNQGLELSEISHETATGTQLVGLSYPAYDGSGNNTNQIVSNSDGPTEFTYAYDSLSRLVSSDVDPTPPADSVSVASTFDPANRIQTNDVFTYTHDAEGRLVSTHNTAQSLNQAYKFNAEEQLLEYSEITDQALPASVLKVQYSYDPLGRRVQKNVERVVSNFFYDGVDRLSDVENGSGVTTFYTNGLGIDDHLSRTNTGTSETFYYHQNRLGSVVALTDSLGTVVQEYEYDAFGNVLAETDPSLVQPYAFTSRERDRESGLYYYRARYYDPIVGTFISEDPIGIRAGINVYAYVENNPVNSRDPTGLRSSAIGIVHPNGLVVSEMRATQTAEFRSQSNCRPWEFDCDDVGDCITDCINQNSSETRTVFCLLVTLPAFCKCRCGRDGTDLGCNYGTALCGEPFCYVPSR